MTIKIVFIIILLILIFTFMYKKRENFSNESLETIVSMYNNPSKEALFNNITSTDTINTMNFNAHKGVITDAANVNIGIGTKDNYMYVAPRTSDNKDWDYTKGLRVNNTGDINILSSLQGTTISTNNLNTKSNTLITDISNITFNVGIDASGTIDDSYLHIYPRNKDNTNWDTTKGIQISGNGSTNINGTLTQKYIVIQLKVSDADYIAHGNWGGRHNTFADRAKSYFNTSMPDGTAKHFLCYIGDETVNGIIYPWLATGVKFRNQMLLFKYAEAGEINLPLVSGDRDNVWIRILS